MRVTTSQAQRSQLDYIQGNLQRLVKAQDQAATGKRFQKGSEDPAATTDVLRADATLAAYAQFVRTGDLASARAREEDRALSSVQLITERARELALQQMGSNSDASTRQIAKVEVDQLLESAIGIGNTRFNNGYLFGGSRAAQEPMANTPTSVPPYLTSASAPANPQYEIAQGQVAAPNHNAHEIFSDTNVMVALRDLSTALGNNDVAGINAAVPALDTASDNVLRLLAETGARVNQLETIKTQMADATVDTKTRRSLLYDIDLSEAATNFAQAQSAYQAALSAANKVLNLNVLDYLR